MRHIAAFSMLCLAAVSVAQEKLISLELRATPISRALPVLSKEVGIPLYDSPQTKTDVIAIKVKAVSSSELLKRLATALNATWQKEGTAYRLVRTPSQLRADQMAEQEYQVSRVKEAMEQAKERLAKEKPWNQQRAEEIAGRMARLLKTFNPNSPNNFYQAFEEIQKEVPTSRFADRAFLYFNPAEIAAIPPQIKVVYSSSPTPTQRRLPAAAMSMVGQFARDMAIWKDAKEAKGVGPVTHNDVTYYFGGMEPNEGKSAGTPAKVLVTIGRWGTEPQFQFEMILADAAGKVISRASSSLYAQSMSKPYTDVPGDAESPELKLSAEDQAFIKLWRRPDVSDENAVSPELRAKLLSPEKFEPLGMLPTSSMFALAEQTNSNLVAYLGDRNIIPLVVAGDKPIKVAQYRRRLGGESIVAEADGWMTISPKRPYDQRQYAVDRTILGRYLRRLATKPVMTLEERALFALSLPNQESSYLPQMLKRLLLGRSEDYYMDERALRFYGLLTPEQLRTAKGEGLPLNALKPAQSAELAKMLYANHVDLQFHPTDPAKMQGDYWNDFYNSIRKEPTESLPNGVPAGAILKITDTTDVVVGTLPRVRSQGWTEPSRYMSADEFAWQSYSQQRPDIFHWMANEDQRLNLDELMFGSRRNVTLDFQFTPELKVTNALLQHNMEEGKPRSLSALPEDFRKKVQAALEQQKKMHEGAVPSGGPPGRNIPPRP